MPKTAGSTFGKFILPQIYAPEQILYDYDYLPIDTLIQKGRLTTETRVIHGHFPAKKYREYYPNAKIVIWLRNPILLLISAYYFCMASSHDNIFFDENHRYVVENQLNLSDFVNQQFTDNMISNYFAKALKLTDFYFVGIQEFFRDDLNDLKNNLGWPPLKVLSSNRNFYDNYHNKVIDSLTNESLVKKIVSLNSADMELYKEALSLRYQRKGLSNFIEMYEQSLKESQSRLRYNSCKELQLNKCSGLRSEQGVNPP
ncbi:hypothetical protein QUB05_09560 [Microcoleus sp. F10-C6]|uniref:hypothetical protein n=1 Tax=unclassified Microcoleus TaxID=2642155 RepID=UPI002FCF2E1F